MAFTPDEEQKIRNLVSILSKQLLANKVSTNVDKEHFEEQFSFLQRILPSQIISQEDAIPSTASEVDEVIELVTDLVMLPVDGSPDSFYHPDLANSLEFSFGDGSSYFQSLKKDDNSEIAFGQNNWVFNPQAGVLWFQDGVPSGVSALLPPKITSYKYIGETFQSRKKSETFNSVLSIETDEDAISLSSSYGDRFLVGTGATSAWTSRIGQIAEKRDVYFVYTQPTDGASVKVDNEDGRTYHFEGTPDNTFRWVKYSFSSVRVATLSGTDTYTASVNPPLTELSTDTLIIALVSSTNTAAVTVDTGFGAESVKRYNTTGVKRDLVAGEFIASTFNFLFHDGSDYVLFTGIEVTGGGGGGTAITDDVIPRGTGTDIEDGTWSNVGNDLLPPTGTLGNIGSATNLIALILGRAFTIGGVVGDLDGMYLAHPDMHNGTDYALWQEEFGDSQFNAPTGSVAIISINNSVKLVAEDGANSGVSLASGASGDVLQIGESAGGVGTGARQHTRGLSNDDSTNTATWSSLNGGATFSMIIRDDGRVSIGILTLTALLNLGASTTSQASLNIASGVANTLTDRKAGSINFIGRKLEITEVDGEDGRTIDVIDPYVVLTDAATVTQNANASKNAKVTVTADRILAISSPRNGQVGKIIWIQDGTGGWSPTLPAGSKVANGGGGAIDLSGTAANEETILCWDYDGSIFRFTVGPNFT